MSAGTTEFLMLDLLGIVFSSGIMFLVILRAIQLDSLQPWFKPPKLGTDSSGLRLRPEQTDGRSGENRSWRREVKRER
jgi:hypothetical protein